MAKITIELDTAFGDTLEKALSALNLKSAVALPRDAYDPNAYKAPAGSNDVVFTEDKVTPVTIVSAGTAYAGPGAGYATAPEVVIKSPSPTEPALTDMDGDRKRGEAAPGHRRRTNAQIKDDELWLVQKERAEAALRRMEAGVHDERDGPDDGKRVYIDDNLQPVISTGEERVNPEDAADEAAETAARPAGPPTLEDLRAAVALYIDKFGHAASVKNMKTIIGCAVAECPVAEIPNAIAKVRLAISGSTVVTPVDPATGGASAESESLFGGEPAAPVTATAADVVAAIKAYARLYDGQDTDQDAMACTKEDLPKVFAATFGKGVTGLGSLPDKKPETLGKILVAIKAATEKNTFKREAKS